MQQLFRHRREEWIVCFMSTERAVLLAVAPDGARQTHAGHPPADDGG